MSDERLTWGKQSWLQPPFEAAPARFLSLATKPPEKRLQPELAAPPGKRP